MLLEKISTLIKEESHTGTTFDPVQRKFRDSICKTIKVIEISSWIKEEKIFFLSLF